MLSLTETTFHILLLIIDHVIEGGGYFFPLTFNYFEFVNTTKELWFAINSNCSFYLKYSHFIFEQLLYTFVGKHKIVCTIC